MNAETIAGLSPDIRELVVWLNKNGYPTTDSGDGSNFAAGMEGACPFPMVAIQVREFTIRRTMRASEQDETMGLLNNLYYLLVGQGVDFDKEGVSLELSYDPHNKSALIILTGVLSKDIGL